MPKYKVEAPNGKTYYVTVPKPASRQELEAAVLRKHPEAAGPGRAEATLRGFAAGGGDVLALPGELVTQGIAQLLPAKQREAMLASVERGRAAREKTRAPAQATHPNYFAGGKLAGEVVATAPAISAGGAGLVRIGGAVASKAPVLGRVLQATGQAVQTGGMGVKTPSRAATIGLRAAGGGISGGAQAAMTEQDVIDAMETGAAVPLIGAIAGKGLGWAYDVMSRRIGDVKAAQILRKLVAEHADDVRAALATASDDVKANTAQFLSKMGIQIPELAAATEDVARGAAGAPLQAVAQQRGEALTEARNVLRGAETATGAEAREIATKEALDLATAPKREAGLAAADVGRRQIVPAEQRASRLRDAADVVTESGFVPRMRGLEQRAGEQAAIMGDMPAIFPDMSRIQQTRGIAGAAGQRAEDAMNLQINLRDAARSSEEAAANLRELGFQPLDVSSVVGRLREAASEAEFVNPARFKVLSAFADNLQNRAKKFGGIVDAGGLYELQKNMGATISDLLGPTDPKSLQKYTAQIIGEVKPLISQAISEAGGPSGHLWSEYMDEFAKGMRGIEQDRFAAAMADLPEKEYTAVMRGERPEFVKEFFGPGHFDVTVELPAGKLPGAQALAADIQAGEDVANMGLGGLSEADRGPVLAGVRTRAQEAMQPGVPNILYRAGARILGGQTGVYGTGNAAQQLEQVYSNKLYENVLKRLAPALASPQQAAALMNTLPAGEVVANFLAQNPPAAQVMSQGATNYFSNRRR